jgi:hypothetical protein
LAKATVSLASTRGAKPGRATTAAPGKPKIARAVRDLIIRGCWLWQFADPAAIEDHFYNIHRDKEFLEYKTLSSIRNA